MATLHLRKSNQNSEAGLGWRITGVISILVGPFWAMFGLVSEQPLHLAIGVLATVLGIVGLVIGWKILVAERGPFLLELDASELRDLRSGESYRWEDVQSLKQTGSLGSEELQLLDTRKETRTVPLAGLDQPAEVITSAAIDHHRRAQGKGSLAAELHDSGATILCPACGEESDSVKSYEYISMLFAFVAYGYQTTRQVGCPSCTRKMIGKNLLINLPTANMVWPIICLPWGLVLLLMSLTHGHSKSVLKVLAEGVAASGHESQS